MSDPEAKRLAEEAILEGTLSEAELDQAEDELIDDYLFGRLTADQRDKFDSHFLVDQKRRDKLNLTRAFIRRANSHLKESRYQQPAAKSNPFRLLILGWRIPATAGAAAAVLALIWLGVRDLRLSRDLDEARKMNSEVERLKSQLAEEQVQLSRQAPTATEIPSATTERSPEQPISLDLYPGLTRGVGARIPTLNQPTAARVVWIKLHLSTRTNGTLWVELENGGISPIWTKKFTHPLLDSAGNVSIALPATLLAPGDYSIRLERTSSNTKLEEIELPYGFHVNYEPVRLPPA
jgi:hypothetical protein